MTSADMTTTTPNDSLAVPERVAVSIVNNFKILNDRQIDLEKRIADLEEQQKKIVGEEGHQEQ